MDNPLVSILIPCYNCERYVGAAIESALNQSYKDIEVIVIDDGSTDNSRKVIDKYSEYIKLDSIPHQGACSARNRALELAQGEYIQFLDADDLLCPEKIELQVRAIEEGDLDWILCQGMHIDENGNDLPLEPAYPSANGCDPFIYLLNHPVQTNIPLHKRNTLKKVGGFRKSLPRAQEYDLHLRIAADTKRMGMVDKRLVKLRVHSGERISSIKGNPGDHLVLLITIAMEMLLDNELNQSRASAMASIIHTFSIYTFRNGDKGLAKLGFTLAETLSGHYDYQERKWVKKLAQIIPPIHVERLLRIGRILFRR